MNLRLGESVSDLHRAEIRLGEFKAVKSTCLLCLQADSGGLCSPGGLSYIGRSKEVLGEIPAAIACKRIHLDAAVAMAAKR